MPTVRKVHSGRTPDSLKPRKKFDLPNAPIAPPKDISSYIIFLYGLKGIGKTSLANQFPNAITLMLEPRRRNLSIRQVPEPGSGQLTWLDVKGYIDAIVQKGNSTCVVDSIDIAYELCLNHVCQSHNVDYPPENDFGRMWVEIREEFASTFNQLLWNEIPTIFTSHAKLRQDKEFDDTPGEEGKFVAPTCAPAAWKYAKQVCDFAWFYGYYEQRHAITVRGGDGTWAATGTEGNFLDPKGNPITTFYCGESPQAAYKSLMAAYNNKLYDVHGESAGASSSDEPVVVKRKVASRKK